MGGMRNFCALAYNAVNIGRVIPLYIVDFFWYIQYIVCLFECPYFIDD